MSDPLAPLRDRFRLRCSDDLTRLRGLRADDGDGEALRAMAHNIAGAAGIFGFSALSEAAGAIDDRYADKTQPDDAQFDELERRLAEAATGPA